MPESPPKILQIKSMSILVSQTLWFIQRENVRPTICQIESTTLNMIFIIWSYTMLFSFTIDVILLSSKVVHVFIVQKPI